MIRSRMGFVCVIRYRCPSRVWLQYSGRPDHHSGLNVRYLPDLLQLLSGDLRPHLAAVCGSCSGDPLRRCTPAPHTTGMRRCNFLMTLQYVSNWGAFFHFLKVLDLHEDTHGHNDEHPTEENQYLWKVLGMIAGIYAFFLMERLFSLLVPCHSHVRYIFLSIDEKKIAASAEKNGIHHIITGRC